MREVVIIPPTDGQSCSNLSAATHRHPPCHNADGFRFHTPIDALLLLAGGLAFIVAVLAIVATVRGRAEERDDSRDQGGSPQA